MDKGEVGVSTSTYPDPPPYYKLYTDDNVKQGSAPKPPPPIEGKYEMFGQPFDTNDPTINSLEAQGIRRLYPVRHNCQQELKKLNHSILVCFLELLDILINNPASEQRIQKIENLQLLFVNMHHLINEFRPHQARETLRVIMERQKVQREEMIAALTRAMETAQKRLLDCKVVAEKLKMELEKRKPPVAMEAKHIEDMQMDTATSSKQDSKDLDNIQNSDYELCDFVNSYIQTVEESFHQGH